MKTMAKITFCISALLLMIFARVASCVDMTWLQEDRKITLGKVAEALHSIDLTLPASIENIQRKISPWKEAVSPPGTPPLFLEAQAPSPRDLACLRDLYDVYNATKHAEMWALRMLDSGSKVPSGILQGNFVDLGQYDECVAIERPNYIGQHCLINLVVGSISPGNGNDTGLSSKVDEGKYTSIGTITTAQCLPSTCMSATIEKAINTALVFLNTGALAPYRIDAVIQDSDCHTKNRDPLYIEEWIVSFVCGFIVLLAILSTAIDLLMLKGKEDTKLNTALKSFSVYTNGKKLFSTEVKGNEMTSINGIKFFSMAWVVLGHKFVFKGQQPLVNPIRLHTILTEWTKMLVLNATLSVDTFFLMSGLLNAYGFFSLMDRKRKYTIKDLLESYVHRFIRIFPPYFIMMAIMGSIVYRVGDGPMWDRIVGHVVENCHKTWWTGVLFINNYYDVDSHQASCLMQSWYLGADMQMFWLAPLVLYPMWRWPLFGKIWLLIVTIGSVVSPFAVSYAYHIKNPFPMDPDPVQNALEYTVLYLPTHTRTISYVVGIGTGYLLQKVRTKKMQLKLNFRTSAIGWLVAGVFLLYSVFGGYWFFQTSNPNSQVEDSFYIAFFRFLWSLGVAWVIIACVTGHGGIINDILSLKIFWPLGRLSYCTYLTHAAVLIIKTGLARTAVHFNDYDVIEEYIGDLFYTFCAGTVLSLLLEAPTMILEKFILGTGRRAPPKRDAESVAQVKTEVNREAENEKHN